MKKQYFQIDRHTVGDVEEGVGEKKRVSEFVYPPGSTVAGSMISGRISVIHGKCHYQFKEEGVIMESGESTTFPSGSYVLKVLGDESLKVVLQWDIPE